MYYFKTITCTYIRLSFFKGLNTWCHSNSVSFKSHSISVTFKFCAVHIALCALEPRSTDSLGTQHTVQNFMLLLSLHQVFRPVVALPTIPTYKRSPFFSLLHCVLAAPSPVYASPHNTHHTLLIWTIGFLLKIVYLMWQERLMKASILYLLACKLCLYKMRESVLKTKLFYSFFNWNKKWFSLKKY